MKKRILSLLLVCVLLCGTWSIASVHAYSETDMAYPVAGGNLYFEKSSGAITDCDDTVTSADIPSAIDGVAVTSIGDHAFSGCTNLTSVTIPNSVTSIGQGAFFDCSSLTGIHVAEGNAAYSSENGVVFNADQTELLIYPDGKTDTTYTIPNSVTSIGYVAFSWCSSLTSVKIPNSVTSIGSHAFECCSSLTSVNIPNSVTSIGTDAFYGTAIYNAEDSWIDGVLYIDNWLIDAENAIEGAYIIREGTRGIAINAFSNCRSLTSVTIPNSVTSIGDYVFFYCSSLTSVTIPESVTSIGTKAFYNCSSLTSVTIPNSVTSIGDSAFSWCSSLTSVTIPNSVTSIGYDAFSGCSSLTSVKIPSSVTSIGDYAFSHCSSLTSVTIPESVTSIGDGAFRFCSSLTSMTIPSSVTSIDSEAFKGCSSLTSITIPEGVTSIGDSAFASCSSLTSVTIPNSVTSIGVDAFNGCSYLTSVTIPDSVTSIGWSAFSDTAIYNAEDSWIDGVFYIDNWLIEAKDDIKGVYSIREGTRGIADSAFFDCRSLTSVTIPNSVTSIGRHAFSDCSSLTSVTIPAGVASIRDFTFFNCINLTSVYFMGNAPELEMFASFGMVDDEHNAVVNIPGLTLYYIEGKEGWTTPEWNGYPTATWKPEEPTPPVEFVDVPQNEWYVGAVDYAVRNGLMGGTSANTFEPESAMTRAMLVTVLWRYEGKPMGYQNTFSDVNAKNGSWYIDAVAWAAANGIVGGVGNNKFDPDGNITREQMATILYRYAKKKGIDTGKRGDLSGFPDGGKVESWAKDAVEWTVAEKIIGGSEGYLLPQGNATRAQVATILMRFIENIVKK